MYIIKLKSQYKYLIIESAEFSENDDDDMLRIFAKHEWLVIYIFFFNIFENKLIFNY